MHCGFGHGSQHGELYEGTLTTGEATVERLLVEGETDEKLVLRVASALAGFSTHPLAAAITRFADQRGIGSAFPTGDVKQRAGYGVSGDVDDISTTAFLGSRQWMALSDQQIPNQLLSAPSDEDDEAAEALIAWGGRARARFVIREALRRADGNKSHAARLLGLTRNALRYRLTQMGLEA